MDETFNDTRGSQGEEFHSVFMDDCTLSTEAFDSDSDDDVVDRHIDHCRRFLEQAKTKNIQFKLSKSKFAHEFIHLLGFKLGRGLRYVDPGKADKIAEWPEPKSLDDLVSFRAYCNFVREFIPNYNVIESPLRKYMKKGAKFADYLNDDAAKNAF